MRQHLSSDDKAELYSAAVENYKQSIRDATMGFRIELAKLGYTATEIDREVKHWTENYD